MVETRREKPSTVNLQIFFMLLAFLAVLRVLIGMVPVREELRVLFQLLAIVIFVAVPVVALYGASKYPWTTKLGVGFLAGGVAVHLGFTVLAAYVLKGFPATLAIAIAQAGLVTWCVGLGALVATLFKDRNLIIPVAIFLAAIDFFLVLTPQGWTRQMIQSHPQAVTSVLAQVPKVQTQVKGLAPAPSEALMGPADFMFLAMFFVAMFRFNLRARATLYAVVPVLILYLIMVLTLGDVSLGKVKLNALPAMVPIGLCVLLVNAGEFKMNKEEKLSTALVAALGLGLIAFGMLRPAPAPAPSSLGSGPGAAAPANSPQPAAGG